MAATDTDVFATHEVLNQPPPLSGYDVFSADDALVEAVEREEAGGALDELRALGRQAGDADWQEKGRLANQNPPVLQTHGPVPPDIGSFRSFPVPRR